MVPGVEFRPTSDMSDNDRRGAFGSIGPPPSHNSQVEFPSLGSTAQQPYKPRNTPWSQNLWGANAVFAPSQENGIDEDEDMSEKKGSAALLSSQDKSPWANAAVGSRWEPNKAITFPRANSPGISPARTYTQPGLNGHAQSKPSLFPTSRTSSSQTTLDPSTSAFYSRPSDTFSKPFGNGRFGELEAASDRNGDHSTSPWTDAPPLQSPTDDRRSVANGDYYNSSRAPSRSDSLPPTRRGHDNSMYQSRQDSFPQNGHFAASNRINGSSTFGAQPHSRYSERSSSIQSEAALTNFHRMQLTEEANEQDRGYAHHRPSASVSGIQYAGRNSAYGNAARDAVYENTPAFRREDSQNSYRSGTPDDLTNGQYMDQQSHMNYQSNGRHNVPSSQFDTRNSSYLGTPNYSNGAATPAYDPLNPSRGGDQSRASSRQGFQPAMLNQRLQHHMSPGFPDLRQFQAAQQTYMPQQYYRSPLNPYQQNYAQAQFMPAMSTMNPMVPPGMDYYPRGPRALSTTDSQRSATLDDFKANSKGTKKWELRELYGHVVEFSGDQHGSRFIQQKLEGANSDEKAKVFAELLDNAQQLMKDVYGNYVIQKFFEHGDQGQKRKLADCMAGNVYELSQQTYGCRVVQKALEFVLVDQQAALVKELEPHVLDCVKHQQGNHVIQKAIERVPAVHIQFIIDALKGSVVMLSAHSYGCRVIQRLLEHKDPAVKASVMAELHDSGSELITHQYGNYVAQHIIKEGGPDDRNKLIGQITSNVVFYSKHKLASNVVEVALLEGTNEQRRVMMSKVIERTENGETALYGMMKDAYGNYVIQKLLQVLSDEDGLTFVKCLRPEMEQARKSVPAKNAQAIEKEIDANIERFNKAAVAAEPANSASATTTPPPLEHDVSSLQSSQSPSANGSTAGDVHVSTSDSKTQGEDQSLAIGHSQNGVLETEAQT